MYCNSNSNRILLSCNVITTNKLRVLLSKNTRFCQTDSHQKEFDYVIESLSKLKFLHPYQQGNRIYARSRHFEHA